MDNNVPQYVVDEAADECVARVKRQLLMMINSTSKNTKEQRDLLQLMHTQLEKLKTLVVEDINAQLEEFFLQR